MKKILILLVMVFMFSALAFAQQNGQNVDAANDTVLLTSMENGSGQGGLASGSGQGALANSSGQGNAVINQTQTKLQNGSDDQLKMQNEEKLQAGLENALSQVKNENAKQQLQKNIESFEQQFESRLQNMNSLEIGDVDEETGAVTIKAKDEVKFLGFIKGKASTTFTVDAQGNVEEKKSWLRFMYQSTSE